MSLGEARIYLKNSTKFLVQCDSQTILNSRIGNFIQLDKFDSQFEGEILNTEVYAISAMNDLVVFHI